MAEEKRYETNTLGTAFYGTGANKEQKALSVSFYGNSIKLQIHDQKPDGKFDYKSGCRVNLTPKQAKIFSKLLSKANKAMYNNEEIPKLSVSSSNNLVEIADGGMYGIEPGLCIVIFNDIGETKTTNTFDVFRFQISSFIENYNYQTGDFDTGLINSDFELFMDSVNEFVKASSKAHAHFNKDELRWDLERIIYKENAIMDKLGIQQNTMSSLKNISWNQNNKSDTSTKVVNMESTDDILSELTGIA